MSSTKREYANNMKHDYDDLFYVRKYLEPAKFKKLALGNWEMPENATKVVTLQELIEAGVQYGHKSNMWNPKMLKYLYADNGGTHIFDLVQTAANLNRACYYCMEAAAKGATFMMIGTKEQAREQVAKYAQEADCHYCDLRFVGGVISNFPVIRKAVELMETLREEKRQNAWSVLSEFKRFLNECKLNRLEKKYNGIVNMTSYPDICIFVDEAKERLPISEMTRIGVPCVGMVDSNNDPTFIDIPIPSNTSNTRSIELILRKLSEAIKKGKMMKTTPSAEDNVKEWDPWILSRDRIRYLRRRSKRQGWQKVFAKDAVIFVRDDHSSTEEQLKLARDLHKAAGGTLWLEFVSEDVLQKVRDGLNSNAADDADILEEARSSISSNGWSPEFNKSLVGLIGIAWKHHITIHALDDVQWSRDAFTARYGPYRGGLRYLTNRADQLDNGEGPIVILAGAEHGPALMKFMKARINVDVRYMYDDFQAIKRHAANKVSETLDSLRLSKDLEADEETENLLQRLQRSLESLL
ncbi:unnamed protein product [Cladocopium goreaui]|uniref:Small ribosomal subunit protein uS2c (30S ribosomal protein S2, chloroplastic) n=1 Tax=Cladocopium goreaui TaxID=2562237 RepID=A0A9P1G9M0_9DINO|nr:unnamed protein product [Cladocopium goreaui]